MPSIRVIPSRNLGRVPGDGASRPAMFSHANPLEDELASHIEVSVDLVLWAGWLDADADPAEGRFAPDHRLWNAGNDLAARLKQLVPVLKEREARVLLRPALGLAISDPHSAAAFLKDIDSDRVGVLVDPPGMLTPEMMRGAEDHLPRMLDKLGAQEGAVGCVLSGASAQDGHVRHEPIDWDRPFDVALRSAWRSSGLAGRDVWIICEACRDQIA